MTEQLTLSILPTSYATFDDLIVGANSDLVTALKDSIEHSRTGSYYIWGKPGNGKTHILQACCHAQSQNHEKGAYLSLLNDNLAKDILLKLDTSSLICIDDINAIVGNAYWEEALFHLYNQVIENKGQIIFAGDQSPKNLNLKLADLTSRLAWGLVYPIADLDEVEKCTALQGIANIRGLTLSLEACNYLLSRCSRNMSDLTAILDLLDRASFAEQRKLTIPFIKEVLAI